MNDDKASSDDHNATPFEEFLDDDVEIGPDRVDIDIDTDDIDIDIDIDIDDIDSEIDTDELVEAEPVQPLTEVEELTIEVREFKNMALRLQADFENYRKRVAAQHIDEVDRATGKIVESLLPVLDACEAAFAHGSDGVEPIWSQLMGVLQKHGLAALDLVGKPFDPAYADAVLHEPGDGGEPVVSEVLRTGYTWKGKSLRAAMVKVRG